METREKDYSTLEPVLRATSPRQTRMAFPKPIRLLAAACMVLFFFLMLQIMRSPNPITPPGSSEKENFASFVRDPNLDGAL